MKKFAVVTLSLLVCVGVAYAGSLSVPFFADTPTATYDAVTRLASGGGVAGFIGVKNQTGGALEVTVAYTKADGTDLSPAANTFSLAANTAVGFRPAANDAGSEGTGTIVPNTASGNGVGSCTLTWTGAGTDIVGRYVEFGATGPSAYLLPAGL